MPFPKKAKQLKKANKSTVTFSLRTDPAAVEAAWRIANGVATSIARAPLEAKEFMKQPIKQSTTATFLLNPRGRLRSVVQRMAVKRIAKFLHTTAASKRIMDST